MSRLPSALVQEIEDLQQFGLRHTSVADQVILAAEVRGVPVVLYLDRDTYPAEPPRLEIAREWLGRERGRPIRGLACQEEWNRTLGLGALLRELEQRFIEEPPPRRPKRSGGLMAALRSMVAWVRNLVRRLFHRRGAVVTDEIGMPVAIRERYEEIIRDKSDRVERYKEAVAQLMTQWQHKTSGLERLGREITALERGARDKMTEAERLVDKLKGSGKTVDEIKADVLYRRCLTAYEDLSADLEEKRQRFAELEKDAKEHLDKIREHEVRLEGLVREVEELEDESEDIAADLATVELEQEIADLRAGISRADADEELGKLLRQFRKAKASVRITREVGDLDEDAEDAEYLEVGRRASATGQFETAVGLAEAAEAALSEPEMESAGDKRLRE